MQVESVRETSKAGNSKGAKRLTVAELEKAKALSALGHSYRAVGMQLGGRGGQRRHKRSREAAGELRREKRGSGVRNVVGKVGAGRVGGGSHCVSLQ